MHRFGKTRSGTQRYSCGDCHPTAPADRFVAYHTNKAGDPAVQVQLIHDCTPDRIAAELRAILPGGVNRDTQLAGYNDVREKIGEPRASERAGRAMVAELQALQQVTPG